ncbi:MAG TPA: type II secretion system protein [Clostridium sp.]
MKKGFTLIEVIISLAILSIAMLGISMAFFESSNTSQMNDVKQNTAGYAQAIIENFRAAGYVELETVYNGNMTTGVSTFVYLNDMSDFSAWFQKYTSGITQVTGNIDSSTYPPTAGNQLFGALIKINKINVAGGGTPYHIYVRVWRIAKGDISQSVRDIYESR